MDKKEFTIKFSNLLSALSQLHVSTLDKHQIYTINVPLFNFVRHYVHYDNLEQFDKIKIDTYKYFIPGENNG